MALKLYMNIEHVKEYDVDADEARIRDGEDRNNKGLIGRWYEKVFGGSPPEQTKAAMGGMHSEQLKPIESHRGRVVQESISELESDASVKENNNGDNAESENSEIDSYDYSDDESNNDDDTLIEPSDLAMARVMKKVMRGEHKRLKKGLEKRIDKIKKRINANVNEKNKENFEMFVDYMQQSYGCGS